MNRFRKISYAWLWPLLFLNASCDKPNDQPSVVKPEVTIEDQNGLEKNEDFIALISIKLSKPATTNVVLRYSTKDITARSGQDYIGVTDVLSIIPAGQSGVLVPVTIIGDKVKEPDETFELVITQALNATIVKQRALITIINDDADSNIIEVPTEGYVSPGEYPGYQLVWSDEFRQPTIDKSNWTFDIGNGSNCWGNNELQYYKEENASIYAEEYLMITAKEESVGGFDYTSSRMITKGKREFKFGRVDIRAAMPIGQGIWPALWSLGADIQTNPWPNCGEIDIMEYLGHESSRVHGTVHWGLNTHKYKGSSTLSGNEGDFHKAFHVFSIIWEKDKIEWYVDDKKYFSISASEMEGQPYPFNNDQFFIINCAVGGNWPGSPNNSTIFPQRFFVDYIRVFQKT